MAYSVELAEALARLPHEVLARLRDSLAEIAATFAALPPGGSEINVVRGERMNLDLMGWRFQYEVDPGHERVRVVEAQRL